MKRFVSILNSGVRQRVSAGLLILVILGVVGEGSTYLALQSARSVASHGGVSRVEVSHAAVFYTVPYQSPERQLGRAVLMSAQAPVQQAAVQPVTVPQSASVAGMIDQVFGLYAASARAVASCESGMNPGAYNASTGASGVYQFLPGTWSTTPYAGYSPFNAWANINAAYCVFARDGYSWREWSCG